MTQKVLKNAKVLLAGNDVSTDVTQVTITYSAQALDNTAMGQNSKTSLGGLFDWPVTLELFQDYSAAGLDSILFPLIGTVITVEIRPDAGARSTSNPAFTGSALLESYEPITGQVGQMTKTKISLKPASDLARQTS